MRFHSKAMMHISFHSNCKSAKIGAPLADYSCNIIVYAHFE